MRQDFFENFFCQPNAVGTDADFNSKFSGKLDGFVVPRNDGAFTIADKRNSLDADFGGILQKSVSIFLRDRSAFAGLRHRIAKLTCGVALTRPGDIHRDRSEAFAALPFLDAVLPKHYLRSVQNVIVWIDHAFDKLRIDRCHNFDLSSTVMELRNLESSPSRSKKTSSYCPLMLRAARSMASKIGPRSSRENPGPKSTVMYRRLSIISATIEHNAKLGSFPPERDGRRFLS